MRCSPPWSPAGVQKRLSANMPLRSCAPGHAPRPALVEVQRKNMALELVADIRRLDGRGSKRSRNAANSRGRRIRHDRHRHPRGRPDRRRAADRTHRGHHPVPEPPGTTPPTTAPHRSKPRRDESLRHRLNPRGNRQLNHALHMTAVTQIRNDTPGRAYYQTQDRGREDQERSPPRSETTDQRHRLPAAPRRRNK